ncbi:MAG TPA: hypothetical protein VGE72_25075 [Azospirillum sp.]
MLVMTANRRLLIQVAPNAGYTIFRHVGCFTEYEKNALAVFNKAVMGIPGKAAVIDMTDSFLIDAFGFGNLLILNGTMAARGKVLSILINGDSTVRQRLHSSGVADIVPVYASLAQCAVALAHL